MIMDINGLKKHIAELETEIEESKSKLHCMTATKYVKSITTDVHNKLCNKDHNEECSWCIDSWDNPMDDRIKYYEATKRLITIVSSAKIYELLDIISEIL